MGFQLLGRRRSRHTFPYDSSEVQLKNLANHVKTLKVGGKTDHLGTLGPKEQNGGVSLVFLLPPIPKTWIGRSQQLGNAVGMDPK